jgi:hypothetical protein
MKTIIFSLAFLLYLFFSISVKAQDMSQNKPTTVADSVEYMCDGTILSKTGTTIIIKITDQRATPAVGQSGVLAKYFEEEIFGMKTTGWLDIGKMKITSLKPNSITMTITEELSVVTKNGVKVDHFKPGNKVHFSWKIAK